MATEHTHTPAAKVDPNQPLLRPHEFDGIQEYDQRLPNWWLATLYIAILWAFFSWIWDFQVSRPLNIATTDAQRVTAEVATVKKKQADNMQSLLSTLDDAKFWEMSKDTELIARGQLTYDTICSACHAKDMTATMPGGIKLPGLPLNDDEWKYGGKPMEVFKIVSKGSPDVAKGMIAWEPQIGGVKVAEVVAYICSKHEPGKERMAAPEPAAAPGAAPTPAPASVPPTQ
jgi:cytochrome c oxidase cbb3-type subunit 3